MTARINPVLAALVLGLAALPTVVQAQTPAPAPQQTQPVPTQPVVPTAPLQLIAPAPPPGPGPAPLPGATTPLTSPVMPPPRPLQAPPGVRSFFTPPEVVGRELTLEEAVKIGLENAPKIVAAAGDYAAARQRVFEALSPLLPQLSGQWGGFQNQVVTRTTGALNPGAQGRIPNQLVTSQVVTTSGTVTASQLLFDFGKTWAATDAAKATAESFRQIVELQKQTIVVNVKTSLFTLLLAKRLVGVNNAALDRALLNLKSAQGFYSVGTQPKSFVTRAEVDVANARVSLIQAQNAVALARVSLNTAMGIAISAPTEVKDILAYEPYQVDSEALVTEALLHRPDYLGIKAQTDSAAANVRQKFRNFFPNVVASGTYGGSITFNEIYNYGVQLTWSIFDGGNMIAQYKEAKANLDAFQARVRDTELTVWQDVQQSYLTMISAEQQIGAAQKAVDSAQENFQLSQGRFDAGVANIIELTDAQLALTQAQSAEAQALANYRIAIAQLERAIGRRY